MKGNHFDIALTGAGMAGLSLAYRALQNGLWADKSVAIFDIAKKNNNDKTWCFWANEQSPFENILHHSWQQMLFFGNSGKSYKLDVGDYKYNMVRSIDFYKFIYEHIAEQSNLHFIEESVNAVKNASGKVKILTTNSQYTADIAFNSIFDKPKLSSHHTYLLQHFKGVFVETDETQFSTRKMHLMDFRTEQDNGCAFFYVLPTEENRALVEYTLFSHELLPKEMYDKRIQDYIANILKIKNYQIVEQEFGVIPMTDYKFDRFDGNIISIGTAGGDTRGSTGYTFSNVQRTIANIVRSYEQSGNPFFGKEHISGKHRLYDSTMLKVLSAGNYQGHKLFTDMFSKVPAKDIFAFLDGQSTLAQDLRVISSLSPKHFIVPFAKSIPTNLY